MRFPLFASFLFVAVALSQLGCATHSLDLSELGEDAIAFRYWKSEDGRQRAELIGESAQKTPVLLRDGIAELGSLSSLFAGNTDKHIDQRFPSRLALLNPRTNKITMIEEVPLGARPLSWSADHKRLIFSSERLTGLPQIYEWDAETRNVRKLSYGDGGIVAAVHGPGKSYYYSKIHNVRGEGIRADLMKYSLGQGEQIVSEGALLRHLALSPDGKTMVYAPQDKTGSGRSKRLPRMVLIDTEPGTEPRLTASGEHPVFTRDGNWVVFSGRKDGRAKLYRMRANGSGRTSIGLGVRAEETPAVSPDGKFIVYVSDHNGLNRMFVMRFDGTGDRLLYDEGMVEWPIW